MWGKGGRLNNDENRRWQLAHSARQRLKLMADCNQSGVGNAAFLSIPCASCCTPDLGGDWRSASGVEEQGAGLKLVNSHRVTVVENFNSMKRAYGCRAASVVGGGRSGSGACTRE